MEDTFSVRSMPGLLVRLLVKSYEKWEAASCGRGQFGNTEEREWPPLRAAAKQRMA
jgi:hypothetical protein